jgi:hypothetical protein
MEAVLADESVLHPTIGQSVAAGLVDTQEQAAEVRTLTPPLPLRERAVLVVAVRE